jgi:hypothetical protein
MTKLIDLHTQILDLYGLPISGKPEFVIDEAGNKQPVYDEKGRHSRLPLTLADLLADQLCNGAVTNEDTLDDDKAFSWAKELDETGKLTIEEEDIPSLESFLGRMSLTRVARWRARTIWEDAISEAQTLITKDIN